ncbi:hypothetical protein DL89DRAFT_327641 [Linderina pennispora]|uniref:Uncharacterized protein n=1 Tax=Linderina pennispora TaxID=61395 RepID=A0A1Y1VQ75_9FUNG|nr:uncharacterized protein DL89DRAFT_327641 [Linderina pennispora]ORX63461.1 hypothetical protein DL89DRAFT_327641 [Linderina pennispora]
MSALAPRLYGLISQPGDGAGQPPFDTSAQQPISDPGDAAGLFPFDGNGHPLVADSRHLVALVSSNPMTLASSLEAGPTPICNSPPAPPNPRASPQLSRTLLRQSQTIPASILERMSSLFNFGQESVSSPSRSAELRTDSLSTQQEESAETPGDLHANTGNVGRSVAACAVAVAAACILSGSI